MSCAKAGLEARVKVLTQENEYLKEEARQLNRALSIARASGRLLQKAILHEE
jgi:hypothetical protein